MFSRFLTIVTGLLVLSGGACTKKDESTPPDPGPPVDMIPVTRDVVDAGPIVLDMDADVYGPGGTSSLIIPDAGPHRDLAPALDASLDLGGLGASCDVFVAKACASGLGCYPKSDGLGTCQQAGALPGGSNCEPTASSPDSRCTPGSICVDGICTALCHLIQPSTTECGSSIGTICRPMGTSSTVGVCEGV